MRVGSVSHPMCEMSFGAIALQKNLKPINQEISRTFPKTFKKIELPHKLVTNVLNGPYEVSKAKKWVAAYTAGNAVLAGATAQAAGLEELALSGVEAAMALHIFNGIYDFKLSKTLLEALATGVKGHFIGKTTFKMASKSLTWIPIIGNSLNATVAGVTTLSLGMNLIEKAEELEKAQKRGESIDSFINSLSGNK